MALDRSLAALAALLLALTSFQQMLIVPGTHVAVLSAQLA